jgi:hypothetical protein
LLTIAQDRPEWSQMHGHTDKIVLGLTHHLSSSPADLRDWLILDAQHFDRAMSKKGKRRVKTKRRRKSRT